MQSVESTFPWRSGSFSCFAMRRDDRHRRHDTRRERHQEFRDRRQSERRAKLPSRERLHVAFTDCVARLGGECLAFDVRRGDIVRAIVDRPAGPVDTEFLIALLRSFRDALREAGYDPEDLDIEVDSPGERRELRTPEHWSRFSGNKVCVEWKAGGPSLRGTLSGVLDGAPIVRLADGTEQRVDPAAIRTMRLSP